MADPKIELTTKTPIPLEDVTPELRLLALDVTEATPTLKSEVLDLETLANYLGAIIIVDETPTLTPAGFTPKTGAEVGATYVSINSIVVSGLTGPVFINGVGLQYSVNGGAWTFHQGTVGNGDSIRVRNNASLLPATTNVGTLNIGAASVDFIITTTDSWAPSQEYFVRRFVPSDLPEGAVASFTSRGLRPKTALQPQPSRQPVRLPDGGLKMTKGLSQWLEWTCDTEEILAARIFIMVFRADLINNPNMGQQNLAFIDGTSGSVGYSHPQFIVRAISGVFTAGLVTFSYNDAGGTITALDLGTLANGSLADKQIIVGVRRGRKLWAWINGVKTTVHDYTGWYPQTQVNEICMIGARGAHSPSNALCDFIIDDYITLEGEFADPYMDKLVGWIHHLHQVPGTLPIGHPYRNAPPEVDAGDFPAHYEYVEADWRAWAGLDEEGQPTEIVGSPNDPLIKFADRGTSISPPGGYEIVFKDTFETATTIVRNTFGPKGSMWYACAWPPPNGGLDKAYGPSYNGFNYQHTLGGGGSVALVMRDDGAGGNITSGAFASVNTAGIGRYFKGPKQIRSIISFEGIETQPRPGVFPAWDWGYNRESHFFRTRNRIEFDPSEADSLDPSFVLSNLHVHRGILPYDDDTNVVSDVVQRCAHFTLSPANGFDPAINQYDGEQHEYVLHVGADFFWRSIDGLLLYKIATPPEMLEPMSLIYDFALRTQEAPWIAGSVLKMIIHEVEVRLLTTDLAVFPAAFSARPSIGGTPTVGSLLTITPNIVSNQLEIDWVRSNGVPIVSATDSLTYTVAAGDAGLTIHAHLRAVDKFDQPEAWTAHTATIS